MEEFEIRKIDKQEPRVETGPVQFGNDWPGVFIRGDNAFFYSMFLKKLSDRITNNELEALELSYFISLLESAVQK